MPNEVVGKECKFVTHVNKKHGGIDANVLKEVTYYKDGTSSSGLRVIKDFKRPFWITNHIYRNHTDKKEWEDISKLKRYYATQSDLLPMAKKLLNVYSSNVYSLRKLADNQYLYGTDLTSTACIKKMAMDKYPEYMSPYSVGSFDIETDVVYRSGHILLASIAFKNKVYTSVSKKFVKGLDDVPGRVKQCFRDNIEIESVASETELIVTVAKDELEVIRNVFKTAHEWGPDFLAVWNINFDIPKILKMCDKYNVEYSDIFSDPDLPKAVRYFKYIEGRMSKVTVSGKFKPIPPSEQWHVTENTAKFFLIDAMSSYRYIRLGEKLVPGGYSLDNVLKKEINIGKLKFNLADNLHGLEWHKFMQTKHPIEYIVYNQWDCISMLELDKKTKDLAETLPAFSSMSDFSKFNSDPGKVVDVLHYYTIKHHNKVISATPSVTQDTSELLGLKGWIITLKAENMNSLGMKVIEESSDVSTNIWPETYDSDAVASYPSDTKVCNVSKETTKREIISIEGIDKEVLMMQNINLSSGYVNSIEYCTTMFGLPTVPEMFTIFEADH